MSFTEREMANDPNPPGELEHREEDRNGLDANRMAAGWFGQFKRDWEEREELERQRRATGWHEWLVGHLLEQGSVAEVRKALEGAWYFEFDDLFRAIDYLALKALEEGWAAEYRLLRCLHDVVTDISHHFLPAPITGLPPGEDSTSSSSMSGLISQRAADLAFDAAYSYTQSLTAEGRYQQALEEVEQALNDFEGRKTAATVSTAPGEREARRLRGQLLRADLLKELGRYEQAAVQYKVVVERAGELGAQGLGWFGERELRWHGMNGVAAVLVKRGNARAGVERYRVALGHVQAWGNRDGYVAGYNNLGNALLKAGRPAEALRSFRQALAASGGALEERGSPFTRFGIGDALAALGDRPQAQDIYARALRQAEPGDWLTKLLYAEHVIDGATVMDDHAAALLDQARAEAETTNAFRLEFSLGWALARWHIAAGRRAEAARLYQDLLERGRAVEPHAPKLLHLQVEYARQLAAAPDTRREAYRLLQGVHKIVTEWLLTTPLDERRGEIIAEWIDLYGDLIDLLVDAGTGSSLPAGADPFALAFALHEGSKSRTFVARLADAAIPPPPAASAGLLEQERRLLETERGLQEEESTRTAQSESYRLRRLEEIQEALRDCREEMRPSASRYVRLRSGEPATLDELRQLLRAVSSTPTALVSFFCGEQRTTCFVLRSDSEDLTVVRGDIGYAALADAARRLRRAFNGALTEYPPYPPIRGSKPWKRDLAFFSELSPELLRFIPALDGIELVCVAPNGPLHLLPLHALPMRDGRYLAERFAITYSPSLTTLSYCLGRASTNVGGQGRPRAYVAGVASREDAHPEFFERDDQLFDPQSWDLAVDIGLAGANKPRILGQVGDRDVVHLTCHGYFDEFDALNSGLLFASDISDTGRPPRNLGDLSIVKRLRYLITARDLMRSHMNAQLVTLRACSTGLQAQRNAGDELDGLTRSVLYAGNRALMVSLWNMDQRSSRELLSDFYRRWTGSGETAEKWRALWEAQQGFINSSHAVLSHPYHWAPLVLLGDWR